MHPEIGLLLELHHGCSTDVADVVAARLKERETASWLAAFGAARVPAGAMSTPS